MATITIGSGITVESGISIATSSATLKLSLDANTYDNQTTGIQQNVSGTSDNIGFFPYGWPAYSAIQPGWTCVQTGAVVTVVDGVNHVIVTVGTPFVSGTSYTFTGENSWIDSVANIPFILHNGVTLSGSGGNSLSFTTASSQYASSTVGVGTLNTWSIEAWHYYTGTNTAGGPCILTELWPQSTNQINYALGSLSLYTPVVQAGLYHDANWYASPSSVTLTAGNWYQIVGTYDGAAMKVYINNSLAGSTAVTYSSTSGNQGIFLMKRWDTAGAGATEYWGGNLGIVKIYEGALNAEEITYNWNANKSRFGL